MNEKAQQHMDDIEIPVIEIENGWPVDDVETIEDCDDAFAYLMTAVASIEFQIDMEALKPQSERNDPWLVKAKCAMKYKKAALQIVNLKRGRINDAERRAETARRERILLDHIRDVVGGDEFAKMVEDSGCAWKAVVA